ncbi:MAG: alpha/beta fold hydrolase [Pseudomonadales bacterium]
MSEQNSKAPPKGSTLTVDGLELHYHDHAAKQAPEKGVVVFIHGSGPGASGYSNFKLNAPVFAEAGYRTLVPDLPGFGYSDKPTDRDYTTELFSESLVGLLKALDIPRYTLIGNSLGGAVAIRAALDHPQQVEKLILMAPGGIEELDTYMAMPAMAKLIENFVGGALDRQGLRNVLTTLVYDPKHVTDELVDERYAILQQQPPEVLSRMKIPNMEKELPNLTCPILSFWGKDDELLPASGGEKIKRLCPASRSHIDLSECGHWVMVEYSQMFNDTCLSFLEEN